MLNGDLMMRKEIQLMIFVIVVFFEFGFDDGGNEPPHDISWKTYRVKWLNGHIENANKLTLTQKREQLKNIGIDVTQGLSKSEKRKVKKRKANNV
jgi:hypothetical protein